MKHIDEALNAGGMITLVQKDCGTIVTPRKYVSAELIRSDGTRMAGFGLTTRQALEYLDADMHVDHLVKTYPIKA